MKENMSSGISAERSCRVPSKGRQRFTRPVQRHWGLWGIAHEWSQKATQRNTTGSPQTLDFTHTALAQQGTTFVLITSFHHQRQLYLAPVLTAYDSHPKAMAMWPLCHSGSPDWFSFRYLPLLQNTRNWSTSHKHWSLASCEQDEVICLLATRLTCQICFCSQTSLLCLWACPATFCNSCFNSSSHHQQKCTDTMSNPHHPFPNLPVPQAHLGSRHKYAFGQH